MAKFKVIRTGVSFIKFLVLLLGIIGPTLSLRIRKPESHQEPEIWVYGYTQVDSLELIHSPVNYQTQTSFQNDFVSRRGNDYVVSGETRSVVFTCEASYPITWTFPFPEQLGPAMDRNIVSREFRFSDFGPNNANPTNTRFKIIISIQTDRVDFLSVNVTCISIENKPEIQSSIYLYLGDKANIENEGKTINITAEPASIISAKMSNLPPLIIPCRPGSPDVKLSLEKQLSYGHLVGNKIVQTKTWHSVSMSFMSFDPKVGFSLQRGMVGNQIFGLYRCSVRYSDDGGDIGGGEDVESDQVVFVNVTKRATTDKQEENGVTFEPTLILHGKASVNTKLSISPSAYSRPQITCCSGVKGKPPKLYTRLCESPLNCQLVKKFMAESMASGKEQEYPQLYRKTRKNDSTDCSQGTLFGHGMVVMCKGETVEYAEHFVNIFRPHVEGPVANRSARVQGSSLAKGLQKTTVTSLSQYETLDIAQTTEIPQKMAMMVGKRLVLPNGVTVTNRLIQRLRMAIIFSHVYDQTHQDAIDDELGGLSIALIQGKTLSATFVKEYYRDVYYEGEPLTFMCFGVKLFYVNGPHLRINWKNGTKTIVDTENFKSPDASKVLVEFLLSGNTMMFERMGDVLVSIFGREMVASQEMSSVDCWMPASNSSRWDKMSKSVKVLPSVAPRFAEKEEEIVYFYLGDVGNVVTCTVLQSVPSPTLEVTRDGKPQPLQINETLSVTKIRLRQGWKNGTRETETVDKDRHMIKLNLNFNDIQHGHQSVFKCIAKNVNGTATRTITIYVLEKHGIALPISLSIAGVLCLIVIGLGVKHWYDKRTVQSLRTSNL